MTEQTFSDPIAHGYYLQGEREISTTQSADEILQKADALVRQDSRTNLMHAACYYLAAAHFLETHDPAKSAHAYHQAGHQLQQLDQFIHAARAFLQAGTWAEQAARNGAAASTQQHLQHGAVRSYSRANHCFAEAGELDESESAYLKERDARVAWAKMQGKHPLALLAWKTTSNYGTSIPRWTAWILGTIMLFSLLYEVFFRVQWLQPDWKSGWGLGWGVARVDSQTRVGHGGSVPGNRTQVSFAPAEKFGVVVLTNSEDGRPGLYVNQAYAIVAPAIAKAALVAAAAKTPTPDSAWAKYAGIYTWEDEEIHVAVLDGKLTMFDPSEDNPWASKVVLEPVKPGVLSRISSISRSTDSSERLWMIRPSCSVMEQNVQPPKQPR